MNVQWHLSPSQINLKKLCPRRWAGSYLLGLKSPPSGGAMHGTTIHAVAENYLVNGDPLGTTPYESMFSPARRYLPPGGSAASEDSLVQAELDMSGELFGFLWKMYADVVQAPEWDWDPFGGHELTPKGPVQIWDLKSSSDPRKYAMTEEELAQDPQAIMYAAWALGNLGHSCTVTFLYIKRWNPKGRAGKPECHPVSVSFDQNTVVHAFDQHVLPWAEQCAAEYRRTERRLPMAFEPNPGACHLYPLDGCPYNALCSEDVTEGERFKALMREGK